MYINSRTTIICIKPTKFASISWMFNIKVVTGSLLKEFNIPERPFVGHYFYDASKFRICNETLISNILIWFDFWAFIFKRDFEIWFY